jgi:hypothetical protein
MLHKINKPLMGWWNEEAGSDTGKEMDVRRVLELQAEYNLVQDY